MRLIRHWNRRRSASRFAQAVMREVADNMPDLQLDEDDYRQLLVVVASWLIDVREKRRAELKTTKEP
jgi:hypothetical protein